MQGVVASEPQAAPLRADASGAPVARKPARPLLGCQALERDGGRAYLIFFWVFNGVIFVGAVASLLQARSPLALFRFGAMLAVGVVISAQSSIIITYIRMKLAMRDYMENNNRFEESLRTEELRVRGLQEVASAFERLDRQFGGSVDELGREIERLQAVSETSMRGNLKTLLRLYCDTNHNRMIDFGEQLQTTVDLLKGVFEVVRPDIGQRLDAMIRGLRAAFEAPAIGVPLMTFLDAVTLALSEDPEKIESLLVRTRTHTREDME